MSQPAPASCFINREASWVEFNRRVLEEAHDARHPLLERVKFLAIFATNLDEFFMIRVSGLREQVAADVQEVSPDGRTAAETLELTRQRLEPLIAKHSQAWRSDIQPALEREGVRVCNYADLGEAHRARAEAFFHREVFPVLTPLAFDPGHPFPHISNLSLSLAVVLRDGRGRERFARVKVPPILPRLVAVDDCADAAACDRTFVWLEQVIAANIQALFPGMHIDRTYTFRVTRDTDIEIQEDEADDLLAAVERSIDTRRLGSAVRLEIASDMPDHIRDILVENLELGAGDVYCVDGPLNLADLWELHRLPLAKLKDPPLPLAVPDELRRNGGGDVFAAIRRGDVLMHHPYDSFTPVIDFVRAAAADPHVLAIKITLYRTGQNSPVVQALIDAINNGKQVAAMVELKARFDEENNIGWARALEDAGVHVVYGFPNLKVHAKVCLVVRKEQDGIRRYVHLSTGNYNATTSRVYTDLGLFTCREDIGQDATDLFNLLTGYSRQREFRRLLVAPVNLRGNLLALIDREIAQHLARGDGRLVFKMNALVDPDVIAKLYEASQAGVRVEMAVRGVCCLCPGVPGLSENIRVISVVGRFLEHSRAYCFHNGGETEVYLGSADVMQRNLDRRVETLFPVLDDRLRRRICDDILRIELGDTSKARELRADGSYVRVAPPDGEAPVDSQALQLQRRS